MGRSTQPGVAFQSHPQDKLLSLQFVRRGTEMDEIITMALCITYPLPASVLVENHTSVEKRAREKK